MRGIRTKIARNGIAIVTAAFLMLAVTTLSFAASPAAILERRVTDDTVLLYVRHGGEEQTIQAHIGTEADVPVRISSRTDTQTVTWLLVDNSLSINAADRETAKKLLTDLVAGRAPNERFNLCTFSGQLTVLAEDSQNYAALKTQIDQLEHKDQETYLTDVLAELLDREKAREGNEFVRVVVISDGVDNNPGGLTREELTQRLNEQAIPIYTLGSQNRNNEQNLKAMYALSRQTNAQSWSLSELSDTLSVVQAMSETELPICVEVTIPEKFRDGSTKGIQLTFGDGAVLETQASMPFGTITEPVEPPADPEPEPAPEPEPVVEPEPESGFPLLLIVLIAVLAVVVIGAVVFLLIRRKKKNERIQTVNEHDLDFRDAALELDLSDDIGDGDTMPLIGNDRRLILSLTDRSDPNRHFETPLRSAVSIGRNPANQIVLDYERSVSGRHCEIFVAGNLFKVRDLGSKNGTYVDGIQIGDVAEISSGSILKLGRLELIVDIR